MSPVVGRLAPTPSGHLHLGNALAFGAAWLSARCAGGRVLLRVEDIDRGRSREEIARAQRDDLRWLGLDWDTETPAQSTRRYPLDGLATYRCDCTRRDRKARPCPHRAEGAEGGGSSGGSIAWTGAPRSGRGDGSIGEDLRGYTGRVVQD